MHKHSMVAFPHIYPMICKYLFSKVVPAVYTSTLFLLLLDRTRALSAASSGHRKVSLSSLFLFFSFPLSVSMIQGHGGTTRIKFLLVFLWIFHITLCAPIIIGLVRSSFHIFKVLLAIIQIILIFIYIDISQVEAWPFPKRYSCQVHFHFSTNHFLYDLIL